MYRTNILTLYIDLSYYCLTMLALVSILTAISRAGVNEPMPDRDYIHTSVSPRFRKLYQMVCEGVRGPAHLGHEALSGIRKELQTLEPGPLSLIDRVSHVLDEVPNEPLLRAGVNWAQQRETIERITADTSGNPRGIDLARRACFEHLHRLEHQSELHSHDALLRSYLNVVYRAGFEDRLPLSGHPGNADPVAVDNRVQRLRRSLDRGLSSFADQLASGRSPQRLRRPARRRRGGLLFMDLLRPEAQE